MQDRPDLGRTPVTTARAASLGWTRSAVRHAERAGTVQRLRRGVVAATGAPGESPRWERARRRVLIQALAALQSSPRSTISHQPAAVAWTIPTLRLSATPCLTVPSGTALRRVAAAHLHRATLPADHVTVLDGCPVTTPARTVLDIAREHGVDAGVAAADYALHEQLTTVPELAAAFEVCARWPGRRAARLTTLLADPAAESVLESLSRLRMSSAGLPAPRPQVWLCDERGRVIGRCDFYWDEFGVIGEADGNLKYDGGAPAIVGERRRQQDFEDTGLIVVRWGWQATASFDSTARRLRTAFERGARRGSAQRRWGVLNRPPSWFRPGG